MLTTTVTMYAQFVLDTTSTLMLLIAFISAAISFPFIQKLGLKIGMRNSFIVTEIFWICSLIPFAFFNGPASKTIAIIMFIPLGIGLAGAMFHTDIIIGSIIDEDEINTGKRREGSYYGINALINRYSTIIVFVLIAVILSGYGWEQFLTTPDIEQLSNLNVGLKVLMVGVNIGAMIIIIILLLLFPLHGERLQKVKDKIKEIRAQQSG